MTPSRPVLYRPEPPLGRGVDVIGYWRNDTSASIQDRALPRGAATLIVDVSGDPRCAVYAADGTTRLSVPSAFVAGPHITSCVCDIAPRYECIAVHFRPGGALPFFGIPLYDLSNACLGLEALWGSEGRVLHERLIEAASVADRFVLVEQFLLKRAEVAIHPHPEVAIAMAAIEGSTGIDIAEAAQLAGVLAKRLIKLFRQEVGLAPKAYARVRRFQAALHRLRLGARGADVAVEAGYFDQAHLAREFRNLSTLTPTHYLRGQVRMPSHIAAEGPTVKNIQDRRP